MARPRKLLIDAYNVLHVTGVLAPEHAGPDLADLADLISRSRWSDLTTRLVCDGAGLGTLDLPGKIEAVFAGPGGDADSLIETLLQRDSAPRSVRVVSSDRRLRTAARRRGAGWMASDEFLRRLNLDAGRQVRAGVHPAPETPLGEAGVETWLERFGLKPDDPVRRIQSAAGRPGAPSANGVRRAAPEQAGPIPKLEHDPAIEEALEEWRNRLSPDDLDMSRWITGVEPI